MERVARNKCVISKFVMSKVIFACGDIEWLARNYPTRLKDEHRLWLFMALVWTDRYRKKWPKARKVE